MDLYLPQFWEPNQKPEPGFDEINWDHRLANGLVAEWILSEGAGRQITNLVDGVKSNFGINALSWVGSYYGSALRMNAGLGGNNFVSISSPPQFSGTQPFSFVTLVSTSVNANVMTSFVDASNYWRITLNTGTNSSLFQRVIGGTQAFANMPSAPSIGPMVVQVGTYNGATLTISVNGSARGTGADARSMPSTASAFKFGNDSLNGGITGPIALVRLYNRALTVTEEQETFRNPFAFYAPALSRSHGALTYAASPLRSRILQSRTIRGAA